MTGDTPPGPLPPAVDQSAGAQKTLGDLLSEARKSAPQPTTPPPQSTFRTPDAPPEPSTARALGASFGLLATFAAAIAFAFVTSRLVGGTYVTFAMPIFVGTLMASLASIGPKRFRFGDRKALVMMMIAGALVCWLGQHLLAYLRVVDIVAAQRGFVGPDAAEGGLRAIEEATGGSGFGAYLAYVSSGPAATLSPIGYLGRVEPGVVGTALIALGELGPMAATASWSILYRTRAVRRPPDGPIAYFDATAAAAAGAALQARRFDELAAILASSTGRTTHALALEEGESTAEAAIFELDSYGKLGQRVGSRLMPIDAAHALRAAIAKRKGGPDAARDR